MLEIWLQGTKTAAREANRACATMHSQMRYGKGTASNSSLASRIPSPTPKKNPIWERTEERASASRGGGAIFQSETQRICLASGRATSPRNHHAPSPLNASEIHDSLSQSPQTQPGFSTNTPHLVSLPIPLPLPLHLHPQ